MKAEAGAVELFTSRTAASRQLAAIHAHWSALCYLGAAQLFCARHALQPRALRLKDIKPRIVGHWGALPGVAYILALASAFPPCRMMVSTGHAAGVVRAELWLRGLLPGLPLGVIGADHLCCTFGAPEGSITEMDPRWPGIWWTGGELGPGLPIAAGAALEARDPIIVLTGDGELETGVASAAALGIGELTASAAVRLCWVLNCNGWRMGGRSRLGTMEPHVIADWLSLLGWSAWVAYGDPAVDLESFAAAINVARNGKPSVLVFTSEKGYTAPARLGGCTFRGSAEAHKLPIRREEIDEGILLELIAWLESYQPDSLFDPYGYPVNDLAQALKTGSPFEPFEVIQIHTGYSVPATTLSAETSVAMEERYPIDGVVSTLSLSRERPLLITCPDELASNRAASLRTIPGVLVAETLSEEVCAAWLWGWTRSGRRGVFLTYEAFAPLIASQLAQYGKILAAGMQDDLPSFFLVQTSLGWHNTPTHANPDLSATVAARRWPFARVWFPIDHIDASVITSRALEANGTLELLVTSKYPLPSYSRATSSFIDSAMVIVESANLDPQEGEGVPILAVGDLALREACAAATLIGMAGYQASVIAVRDLTALGSPDDRLHALGSEAFSSLVGHRPGVVVTITSPLPVAALLAERKAADRFKILGYLDVPSTTPLGTLLSNHCDRWSIAKAIVELETEGFIGGARSYWLDRWEKEREQIWRKSITQGYDEPLTKLDKWIVRP